MLICAFYVKILHTKYLSINSFLNIYLQIFFYTDCRMKLYSIKSERFEGVYWKSDEKSPFVYISVFWVWRSHPSENDSISRWTQWHGTKFGITLLRILSDVSNKGQVLHELGSLYCVFIKQGILTWQQKQFTISGTYM